MSRPRVIALLLALITLLIYAPVTRHDFLNYDDGDYVTENQMVQNGLTWAGFQWAFATHFASNWHPLTWLSHMTDCELFRLNPGGHHFVNILIHAANAVLLFLFLFRLTRAIWPSALVAALFAWHPLHVESVAWISERKDVLSTFFALLALLSYARFCQKNCRSSFWWALVFFALGLMAKPMLVTLPCVMMLLDYWPLQRFQSIGFRRLLLEKWPFFLLTAISCIITFIAQRTEAVATLQKVSLGLRLENLPLAYTGYLLKTIWPANLAVFYPLSPQIAWQQWMIAAAALIVVTAAVWLFRRRSPYLLMGWFWFLGTLVPVIGLVQVGDQAMADRYSYFPLIGIFIAAVFGAAEISARFQFLKIIRLPAAVLILLACLVLTENQLSHWQNSETLFTHALAVTKDNALARINLGAALQVNAKPEAALAQYQKALRLDPLRYEAWSDIAKLLYEMDRPEAALTNCLQAVRLNPQRATLHNSLGLVLAKLNRLDEAVNEFSVATQLDSHYATPRFQMGQTFLKQGKDAQAIVCFHDALRLEPDNYPMLIRLARVLASDEESQVRNGNEALAVAGRASRLANEPSAILLDTVAMAFAETGQFEAALQNQRQAVQVADATGQKNDAVLMQQRAQLYLNHQPWRESFHENHP